MNEDVDVYSIESAVAALQNRVNKYNNEGYVESWSLCIMEVGRRDNNNNNDDEQDNNFLLWEEDDPLLWDRFLTLLSQESSQTRLEDVTFMTSYLDRPNDEVLERLFRDVLPTIASVKEIYLTSCKIMPAYMDMLLTSLHNNNANLQILDLEHTKLHSSSVDAIARLLRAKKNGNRPPIEDLCLAKCSIDSAGCELILKALDGNTCLRDLNLSGNQISEISLEAARALGNCKNIQALVIDTNPLSDQSLCHLAEGLRTNHSLKELYIMGYDSQLVVNAFAELLKTFNYCLQDVIDMEELQEMEVLRLQNQRIRRLHDNLLEEANNNNSSSNTTTAITTCTGSYQLKQLHLWPLALECIGSKPSLIYRFVRQGNLESFMDQLLLAGSSNSVTSKSIQKSKEQADSKLCNKLKNISRKMMLWSAQVLLLFFMARPMIRHYLLVMIRKDSGTAECENVF